MRHVTNLLLFTAVVFGVVGLVSLSHASGLSAISSGLSSAEGEIRGSIFPAVAGIITAVILIGVAAGVGRVLSRGGG